MQARTRSTSNGRAQHDDRWAVPVLDARRGRAGRALRRPAARTASRGGVLRGAARGLRRARPDLDRARAARDRRAAPHRRPGPDRRERRQVDRRRAHAVPDGRLGGRLDARRRSAAADPGRSDRARVRDPAQVADRRASRSSRSSSSRRPTASRRWRCRASAPRSSGSRTFPWTRASRPVTRRRRSRSTPGWSCSSRRGSRPAGCASLAWAVAIVIPIFVALARMYRGMHHPLDVAGGLVIGIGALLVLLFACRAAGVAHAARSPQAATVAASRRAQPVA